MSFEDKLYPFLRLYEASPQWMKSAAGHLYRALPSSLRLGANYGHFRCEAEAVSGWSAEEITNYQIKAARESLLAASKAPLYARRFAQCGVDPRDFKQMEDLKNYPTLCKQDLLEHREDLVNPESDPKSRLLITTGGSSGVPVGFYLERGVSRPKEQAYLESQWGRLGYRAGDKVAVIRGGVTSSRAEGQIHYHDAARNWLVLSSYHLTEARTPEYVRLLDAFRPRHLHMYPSSGMTLAKSMRERGLKLTFVPQSILCGSERLGKEERATLETVFGAPVYHWYGHSERVVLAGQGKRGTHLYCWPTYGFAELGTGNDEGRREIIGTSFHNRVMPLIRYRTGDFVRVPDRPEAEFAGLEIAEVCGREYEFLVSSTGRRISLTAINMHDGIFEGLAAVQFYQDTPGRVEARCEPLSRFEAARLPLIERGLLRKLGDDFCVDIRLVDSTEKTGGGKHKWLVSPLMKSLIESQQAPVADAAI